MYALSGYIDGNSVIADENIKKYEGCNVIITILDGIKERKISSKKQTNDDRILAAKELAGMWASYDDCAVDDMVRNLRRGRNFDI